MDDKIEGADHWATETYLAASRKYNECWWLLDGIERQGGSAKLGTDTTKQPDHMATDATGNEWYVETKMVSGEFKQIRSELAGAYFQILRRPNCMNVKRRINITITQECLNKITAKGEDPMDEDDQFSKRKHRVDRLLSGWMKIHSIHKNGGIHELWVFYPDGETKCIPSA